MPGCTPASILSAGVKHWQCGVGVMRFTEAVRSGFARYADTTGRSSRSAYWWWLLFANVVIAIPSAVNFALTMVGNEDVASDWLVWALRLLLLGLLVPSVAVSIRRLHDVDRSSRWLLVALAPVLGTAVLVTLAAMPGTPGPNRYGAQTDSGPIPVSPDAELINGHAGQIRVVGA
jgi:uncharacterized membrane protein YhaH (DUF805 family)